MKRRMLRPKIKEVKLNNSAAAQVFYLSCVCTHTDTEGKQRKVRVRNILKSCDSSELCQVCCSAGVLPAWCVYTHWHQGKTEKGQSPKYFKIFGKNTIFNEHPVAKRLDNNLSISQFTLSSIFSGRKSKARWVFIILLHIRVQLIKVQVKQKLYTNDKNCHHMLII